MNVDYKVDLLVLGMGAAAELAAIYAHDANPDLNILIATKALKGKGGCSRMVQGGFNVVLDPGDSHEKHLMDTLKGGQYINDQDLALQLVEQATPTVKELETISGCFFDRRPDGHIHQKAFAGQCFDRTVHKGDLTGIEIISRTTEQVFKRRIPVLEETRAVELLLDAEAVQIPCANGLWMLVAQAKESAEYFIGKSIDDAVIAKIYGTLAAQMANIVLIGMPGCGKSTVGALLADKLGRKLVDADEEIVRLAGKPIPAIFAEDGEAVFRDWETNALSRLGKQSALVIATGGGCVTQIRNYPLLHQNGTIFWLKRDISKLPTDGRPLSQTNPLDAMFAKRAPMYAAFADHAVSNDGSAEETVAAILSIMEEPI